jgi:hypothetical protein
MEVLNKIQKELKAPKGQHNAFGNYNYRSCEDILEAVKPLLGKAILTLCDDMVILGDRFYVKATVTIADGDKSFSVSAFARESLDKKGMDTAQITGAASSYARKYALNGLFCIDDTKDADHSNKGDEPAKKQEAPQKSTGFKLMASKYAATCKGCGEPINEGDDIAYSKEKGVFHPDCAI